MSDKAIASDVCPDCGGEMLEETLPDPSVTGHVWTKERFNRIEACDKCRYWRPSRKPKPFTLRERARRVEDQRKGEVGVDDPGRWDATLRTVEAERDDLEELAEYLADCTEWDELRDALIGHPAGAPKSEGAWRALFRLADKKETLDE